MCKIRTFFTHHFNKIKNMNFRIISEREKFVVIVITLVLAFCCYIFKTELFYDKPKTKSSSTYIKPDRQIVVIDKISISEESSYQHFIVSGKNFEFNTSELIFNVNDTIVIEGDKVFPKNKPFNFIKKY